MDNAQDRLLQSVIDKKIYSEKIVNHDIDLTKWNVKALYKDTLWVKLLDEPDADLIQRGSLYVKVNMAKGAYRLGEVIMTGPDAVNAKAGDKVIIPQMAGQPGYRSYEGYKTWFVKEDAVMAVLVFDGDEAEMRKDIEEQLLLNM
jgi:hypothetical protein